MSDSNGALEFNLDRKEKPVKLKDKNGIVLNYVLRELDGAERDKWLNRQRGRTKMSADGRPVEIKDFTGAQADLISVSLFDDQEKNVPVPTIQSWPSSLQTFLFLEAISLSGLNLTAEQEAKNV